MLRILPLDQAQTFITRKAVRLAEAEQTVAPILDAVRKRGDEAVLEYARKFDGLSGRDLSIPPAEWRAAESKATPELMGALNTAAKNIREYAELQLPQETWVRFPDGRRLGYVIRPLESMGAYIPAGRYPLPSTILMTVIPAQVAGVKTICVTSPRPTAEILITAKLLGVENVFRVGGAQAIAALAFGTATIPKVDRIVGPGNIYVAAAKKLLAGEVGIDFVAGPTEIVIIAEEADPRHLAADMLAQAEHDVEASAILLTTSGKLAEEVAREVARQLETLPTAPVACESIRNNSAIILCPSVDAAIEASNRLAPEHLAIYDEALLPKIQHAGSVFLGAHSPEAAGDYASGPNHVLPTSGAARVRGGLSPVDFVKVISVQELTPEGLIRLAPAITTLARAEGLEAHARSVEVRLG
ncbi:MAG TPA: histidinol dehydrogenase [Bryobacteraceae bacterium]|jgi:histidinol dehydrogenase|nr:histidinol dehydrogenase [Bryobacteraceae bacterium]